LKRCLFIRDIAIFIQLLRLLISLILFSNFYVETGAI
jgi:hypothetical protein